MSDFYLKSGAGAVVLSNKTWATGSPGDRMVPTLGDATSNVAIARRWVWECTTGGTTNGTPTWPASVTQDVTTVTQNSTVFTARKPGFSSGTTANWALAAIYMHYVASALAAGDRLLVSNNHAETQATVTSNSVFPGTLASPNQIICGDDSAAPPTSITSTATVTTTGAFGISLAGTFYCYGISFSSASGGTGANFTLCSASAIVRQVYEKCQFKIGSTVTNTLLLCVTGTTSPAEVVWLNCDLRLNATGQKLRFNNVKWLWHGGSYLSGGTLPTGGILTASIGGVGATAEIEGVDFSNFATGTQIISSTAGSVIDMRMSRCKFPASWVGGLFAAQYAAPINRASIDGFDSSTGLYKLWQENYAGVTREETAVVRTGGSTDGTTPLSWRMTPYQTNISYPKFGMASPTADIWNDTTGSSKNVAVEIIHMESALLTNADIYISVDALTNSGTTESSRFSDAPADALTAATNQTTSSAAWDSQVTARANSQAYTAYNASTSDSGFGSTIKVASNPGRVFFCITGGTSAGSEPGGYSSAVDGGSVTDGTAVFRAGWRQKLDVSVTPQVKGPIRYTVAITKATVYNIRVDPLATIT